jgi:tRNA (guanine37-N1)-methyltransferase
MRYVFVAAARAEEVKQMLAASDALADAPVLREDALIGFPVTRAIEGFEIEERDVSFETNPKSLREALVERFGERGERIKRAFDVIGDIAIIETTRGFEDIERAIAEELMRVHRNVHAVYVKGGAHEGEYRVQEYRLLAGEQHTRTVHTENGYTLELDIAETYFSPRVGGERMRIARLVRPGERVLVIGSGIAPYGVCIDKHADPSVVVCVEFNEAAHRWAERNVSRNRCTRVEAVNADAYAYLEQALKLGSLFDRIILPLPAQSSEMLPEAWKALRQGGVIHHYTFLDEDELDEPRVWIEGSTVEHIEKVGAAAPGRWRVCIDLRS